MEQLFESILIENGTMKFSAGSFAACFLTSLLLGMAVAYIYMYQGNYRKNFVLTLALLPALVQVIITLVNGSLGTGIAAMGAFSLVRFRSIPGTSKEISSIFFAMAAGLAAGMGYLGIGVVFVAVLGGASILLQKSRFGEMKEERRLLRITIPESLDYTQVFDDLFLQYTKSCRLIQVKTTNLGSLFKLEYEITLKNMNEEKKLIDDLRCRNGNLEILCSAASMGIEEAL
ncbi:MAG: DUF4956 domain-containing protein [Eubacteriales bacterium]|nr:DUF4956 domain-containing protein [Eubacteriales bacterium]